MATCKDCLHCKACTEMLKAMGYTVDGDGKDADKRCSEFQAAADVAPVVHAEEIPSAKFGRTDPLVQKECSNCGCGHRKGIVYDGGFFHCPNCGARVDGKEKTSKTVRLRRYDDSMAAELAALRQANADQVDKLRQAQERIRDLETELQELRTGKD